MNLNNLLAIPFYESSFAYERIGSRNTRRTDNDGRAQGPSGPVGGDGRAEINLRP